MIEPISELKKDVIELGKKIAAPLTLLQLAEYPTNSGRPHFEIRDGKYHYVVTERGEELYSKITDQKHEILYWIFKDITSELAAEYEFKHREKDKDFRRLKFSKQLELMGKLDAGWRAKIFSEIEEILKNAAYDDSMDERTSYCKNLMRQGLAGEAAYAKACQVFPLPL